MAFCKNCGTELDETIRFCHNCGTPVNDESNKKEESSITINFDKSQLKDVSNKISGVTEKIKTGSVAESFKALGKNQRLFLVTAVCVIFSIILTYADIFEVKFLFTEDSYSSFGICEMFLKWMGLSSASDKEMMSIIQLVLKSGPVFLGISVGIMSVPIIFSKKYRSGYIVPVILSTIYNLLCQSLFYIFMAMTADEMSFKFGLTFVGILFVIESIATFITAITFGGRVRIANKRRAE